eukprot:gene2777-3559_t
MPPTAAPTGSATGSPSATPTTETPTTVSPTTESPSSGSPTLSSTTVTPTTPPTATPTSSSTRRLLSSPAAGESHVSAVPQFAQRTVAPPHLEEVQSESVDPFFAHAAHRETAWWVHPDLPIPGEFLRTVETELPQVRVAVKKDNDTVLAVCNATDGCGFTFAEPLAEVLSISPAGGGRGELVTVTGSGFATADSDRLVVEVGGAECEVVGVVNDTAFTCIVGECPVGAQPLKVRFLGHGYATMSQQLDFLCQLALDSVEPAQGSLYGGLTLTLRGHGFAASFLGASSANRITVTPRSGADAGFACVPRKYKNPFCGDSPDDVWSCPYEVAHAYLPLSITEGAYWLDFSNDTYIECELQETSSALANVSASATASNLSGYPVEDPELTAGSSGFGCGAAGRACGEVYPDQAEVLAEADVVLAAHPLNGVLADIRVAVYAPPDTGEPLNFDENALQLLGFLRDEPGVLGEDPTEDLLGSVQLAGHFSFEASATPVVTAAEPATGPPGSIVTVRGRGLNPSAPMHDGGYYWHGALGMYMRRENRTTEVSEGVYCDNNNLARPQPAEESSGEAYACLLMGGPRWTVYPLAARVYGRGLALSFASFRYAVVLTGVGPTVASFGGGTLLTVTGAGFTPSYTYAGRAFLEQKANFLEAITPGGGTEAAAAWAAEVVSVKPHQVVFRLPQVADAAAGEPSWEMRVTAETSSLLVNHTAECEDNVTQCQVAYSPAVTPTVREVFPPGGNEGDTLRVYGDNLLGTTKVQLAGARSAPGGVHRYSAGACSSCLLEPVVNCTLAGAAVHLIETALLAAPHHLPPELAAGGRDVVTCVLEARAPGPSMNASATLLYLQLHAEYAMAGAPGGTVVGDATPKLPVSFGVPVVRAVSPAAMSGAGGRVTIHGSGFAGRGGTAGQAPVVHLGGLHPAYRRWPEAAEDPSWVAPIKPARYTLQWQTGCDASGCKSSQGGSCGSADNFTVEVTGSDGHTASVVVDGSSGAAGNCTTARQEVDLPHELGAPTSASVKWDSSSDAWGVDWLRLSALDFGCVADWDDRADSSHAELWGCALAGAPYEQWCAAPFEPVSGGAGVGVCNNRAVYFMYAAGGTRLYMYRGRSSTMGELWWVVTDSAPVASTSGGDDCGLPGAANARLLGLPHKPAAYGPPTISADTRAQLRPWDVELWLAGSPNATVLNAAGELSVRRASACNATSRAGVPLWEMAADPEYELRELPWRRTRAACSFGAQPLVGTLLPSGLRTPSLEFGRTDSFGLEGYRGSEKHLAAVACSGRCEVVAYNDTYLECQMDALAEPFVGLQAVTVQEAGAGRMSLCGVAASEVGCAVQLVAAAAAPWTPALNLHDADELVAGAAAADPETWQRWGDARGEVAEMCGALWPPIDVECATSAGIPHLHAGMGALQCAASNSSAGVTCNASALPDGADCVDFSTRYLCPIGLSFEQQWLAVAEGRGLLNASVASNDPSPTVLSATPLAGHAGTEVTITGRHFLANGNTVRLGAAACDVIAESSEEIRCRAAEHPARAVPVVVTAAAGTAVTRTRGVPLLFSYIPVVEAVEPSHGSWGGGVRITITGRGLGATEPGYAVVVLEPPCAVESANGTHLVCVATPAPCELPGGRASLDLGITAASCGRRTGPRQIQVAVRGPDGALSTPSSPSNITTFAFEDAVTPVLAAVSSFVVSDTGYEVALRMHNLGTEAAADASKLSVRVGEAACTISSLEVAAAEGTSTVTCSLEAGAVTAGFHEVTAAVTGRGRAVRDWPDEAQSSWMVFEWPGLSMEGWERVGTPCSGHRSAVYPGIPNVLNGAADVRHSPNTGYCAVSGGSEAACGGAAGCCLNLFGAHAHCPEILRSPAFRLDDTHMIRWSGDIALAAGGAPAGDEGVWMALRRAEAAEGERLITAPLESLSISAAELQAAVSDDAADQSYTLDFMHLGGGGYASLLVDRVEVMTKPVPASFCAADGVTCPLAAPQVEVPLVVSEVSPAAGSYMGGTLVTLTGSGFHPERSGNLVTFRQRVAANYSSPKAAAVWTMISGTKTCQFSDLSSFRGAGGKRTLEACKAWCGETEGCAAIDHYTWSNYCGLYYEACTVPVATHHGASSYRLDTYLSDNATVIEASPTSLVVRTPQLLPFDPLRDAAATASVDVIVQVRRNSSSALITVRSGTCAYRATAPGVQLTAPDGSALSGSVDFAGTSSDGIVLFQFNARTLRPTKVQLFDTYDPSTNQADGLAQVLDKTSPDTLVVLVSNRRWTRDVPQQLADAFRRCGMSKATAVALMDGDSSAAPGLPYDQLAMAGVCTEMDIEKLASTYEAATSARGGCWDDGAAAVLALRGEAIWAASVTLPSGTYQYDGAATPVVQAISPRTGSTAGGTQLEITGRLFGESPSVTVDGSLCASDAADVASFDGVPLCNYSLVNCTGLHAGPTLVRCVTSPSASSDTANQVQCDWTGCTYAEGADYSNAYGTDTVTAGGAKVLVDTPTGYAAVLDAEANYTYIDKWSSRTTWGGAEPPGPGESAMIPAGTTVLFDVEHAELHLLIIAGTLLFDDSGNRNLTAGYIWLNQDTQAEGSAARLQVGTLEEPFQHKATITLVGNRYSEELPLIGAKVLGGYSYNQHGVVVDIHGVSRAPAFTFLNHTAQPGDEWLTMQEPVEWEVGDHLALGPTDYNLEEREELRVLEVADGGRRLRVQVCTLRLTGGCAHWGSSGLLYKHFAETFDAGGRTVDWYRAPIARLTRNVVVTGDNQTVGQQFGAQIQFTATDACNNFEVDDCVVMRLSNVEVALAGQGFFIGRYPIHFHRVGNVPLSFVFNNTVHDTFNRAITIHGLRNYRIEHNVMFESRGHSLFIEDGNERNNTVYGNLGIVVRAVWSQLKVDETPAMFWMTNPDNRFQNNVACGSTHYGFWLRMLKKPDGLSESMGKAECPIHTAMPYGHFDGNMAMSTGKYGMRFDPYYPAVNGDKCDISLLAVTSILNFKAAKTNLHGIYVMDLFAAEFVNLQVIDPRGAGIEFDRLNGDVSLTTIRNALFVDKSPNRYRLEESKGAIVLSGQDSGLHVVDTIFVNHTFGFYAQSWPAGSRGGFQTYTERLSFVNVKHRAGFGFENHNHTEPGSGRTTLRPKETGVNGLNEHALMDMDGSLTGWDAEGYCTRELPCYAIPYETTLVQDARCDNTHTHNWADPGSPLLPAGGDVEARVFDSVLNGIRFGGLRCHSVKLRQMFFGPISGLPGHNLRATKLYLDGTENTGLSGVSAVTYNPTKECGLPVCTWDDGTTSPTGGYKQSFGGFNICINLARAFQMMLEVGESYDIAEESPTRVWTDINKIPVIMVNAQPGDHIVLRYRLKTDYGPHTVVRVLMKRHAFNGDTFGASRLAVADKLDTPDATFTGDGSHGFFARKDPPEYQADTGRQLWGIPDPKWRLNTTRAGVQLEGRQVAHYPFIRIGSSTDPGQQLLFGGSNGFTIEMFVMPHEPDSISVLLEGGAQNQPDWLQLRLYNGYLLLHAGDKSMSFCQQEAKSAYPTRYCYVNAGSMKLNAMRWTHVAITHDGRSPPSGGELKVYIDGRLESVGLMERLPRTERPMAIGYSGGANSKWRRISLDNFRVWDDKLDASLSMKGGAAVIAELAQGWVPPSDSPGLVLEYRFEEDFSGSGCSGPLERMGNGGRATEVDLSAVTDRSTVCAWSVIAFQDSSLSQLHGASLSASESPFYGLRDDLVLNSTGGNFSHGDYYYSREENAVYMVLALNSTLKYQASACPAYGCPPPEVEESFRGPRSFAWSSAQGWGEPMENAAGDIVHAYTLWRMDDEGEPVQSSDPTSRVPVTRDSVMIPEGWEVLLDTETPVLNRVDVYGTLRCPNSTEGASSVVAALSAHQVVIWSGGRVVCGTPEDPFGGAFTLTLHGNFNEVGGESFVSNGNVRINRKTLMAWGELTLVGLRPEVTWTRLAASSFPGNATLVVEDARVGAAWVGNRGWEVVITSSSLDGAGQSEVRRLQKVQGRTLTLDSGLQYYHHGEMWTPQQDSGGDWPAGAPGSADMRAAVGLLTRNIIVRGGDLPEYDWSGDDSQDDLETGGQIICGSLMEERAGWSYIMRGYLHRGLRHHLGRCHLEGVELTKMGTSSGDCARVGTFSNGGDPSAPYAERKGDFVSLCRPALLALWHQRGVAKNVLGRFPQLRHYHGVGGPTHVLGCSFHRLFNSGIHHFHFTDRWASSENWLHAIDNVMYDVAARGIWDAGDLSLVRVSSEPPPPREMELQGEVTHNLVVTSKRLAPAYKHIDVSLYANEKLSGLPTFHVTYVKYNRFNYAVGQPYGPGHHMSPRPLEYGNSASGCLFGFWWDSEMQPGSGASVGNLTAWKCRNYGLLAEHKGDDLHVSGVVTADIGWAGLFTKTTSPGQTHRVSHSLFGGRVMPHVGAEGIHATGVMLGDVSLMEKEKPMGTEKPNHVVWLPLIGGRTTYSDIVFASFPGPLPGGKVSKAVISNDYAEEYYPPAFFSSVVWVDTPKEGRVLLNRSQLGGTWDIDGPHMGPWWPKTIQTYCNPLPCLFKCQTFPCDAFQHNRVVDVDGSLMGDQWADGTRRSGNLSLVPMQPVYESGGRKYMWPHYIVQACQAAEGTEAVLACPWFIRDRDALKSVADNPEKMGVVRADRWRGGRCEEMGEWGAYACENMRHATLHVKSTDARDLESDNTERTSAPFGVYDVDEGYLDLLAGQNSWQPRRFDNHVFRNRNRYWPILAANHTYQFFFTGKPPTSMDFIPIDFDADTSVRIQMFLTSDSRKEIWANGALVTPSNSQEEVALDAPTGTNYWHQPLESFTFVVTGTTTVSLKTTKVIMLASTLAVDESNFYAENFIQSIVMSLSINPLRLRIVSIVPGGRRRRSLLAEDDVPSSVVNWEIAEEDRCAEVVCLNGGQCSSGRCLCETGTTGPRCATVVVECTSATVASVCASRVCSVLDDVEGAKGICLDATCEDGVANQDETGADCGGPTCAARCAAGLRCAAGSDCLDGVCAATADEGGEMRCAEPTCSDGFRNGDETGVDCGGTCALDYNQTCGEGEACAVAEECNSGSCSQQVCVASTCLNEVQDAAESDVDCGGGQCVRCGEYKLCAAHADCAAGLDCKSDAFDPTLKCRPMPTCTDDERNQNETDVDCGGDACDACAQGMNCTVGAGCLTGVCTSGVCTAGCDDGVLNQDESDADCGGTVCGKCDDTLTCRADSDCKAGSRCACDEDESGHPVLCKCEREDAEGELFALGASVTQAASSGSLSLGYEPIGTMEMQMPEPAESSKPTGELPGDLQQISVGGDPSLVAGHFTLEFNGERTAGASPLCHARASPPARRPCLGALASGLVRAGEEPEGYTLAKQAVTLFNSTALKGTFSLGFQGLYTKPLLPNVSALEAQEALIALGSIGEVAVYKEEYAANSTWTVVFLHTGGTMGDKPHLGAVSMLTVDSANLVGANRRLRRALLRDRRLLADPGYAAVTELTPGSTPADQIVTNSTGVEVKEYSRLNLCNDSVLNGNETGVDCGDPACIEAFGNASRCGVGAECAVGSQCDTGLCPEGVCTEPPVNCEVTAWTAFSDCSAACGGGEYSRNRTITRDPAYGGMACPTLAQTLTCNTQACPVDCVVSAWAVVTPCSANCSGGTQNYTRAVEVQPAFGGEGCGALEKQEACNTRSCPGDCPEAFYRSCTETWPAEPGREGEANCTGAVSTDCAACPANTTARAGSTAASECLCDAGLFLPLNSSLSSAAGGCTPCELGTFKESVQDGSNAACVACPFGSTTAVNGSVSVDACTCEDGYLQVRTGDTFVCTLPPPPPLFPSDFECPFACVGETECPCSAYQCAGEVDTISYDMALEDPPCMDKVIGYCHADSRAGSDPGCKEFLARKIHTHSVGGGGEAVHLEVEGSGYHGGDGAARSSKLHVPGTALGSSTTVAMTRSTSLDVANLTMTSLYTGLFLSDVITLTPHGQAFDDDVTLELPFNGSVGGPALLRADNSSAAAWAPYDSATMVIEDLGNGSPTAAPSISLVNVTVVSTKASFSAVDISALDDATYKASFESSVKSQLATAAGVSTSDVTIVSITSGSVNVNVEVAFYPTT